jgi:hypothetical protein
MLPRLRRCTLLKAQTFAELQSLPLCLCAWPLQYVSQGLAARQTRMSWPSVSNLSAALPTEAKAVALALCCLQLRRRLRPQVAGQVAVLLTALQAGRARHN